MGTSSRSVVILAELPWEVAVVEHAKGELRAPPAACSLRLILGCRRSGSPRSRLASALGLRRLRILGQMSKCTGQLQTEQCHYTHPARKTKKTLYMGPLHLRACGRSVAPPRDRLAPQRALIRGARSNEAGRRRPMTSMLWSGRQRFHGLRASFDDL